MAWWWWVGGLLLVIVGFRPARQALKRQILQGLRRKAARPRRTTTRPARRRSTPRRSSATPWKPVQPVPQRGTPPPKPLGWARPQRCSMACRQSRKPASTCDCACGGRAHGKYRPGTAAAIRATKVTPAQKAARRRVVEDAATKRWEAKQKALRAKAKPVGDNVRRGRNGERS